VCVHTFLLVVSFISMAVHRCVGDQFAMLEATVALAMLLQKYDFQFSPKGPTPTPEDVGTNTGATIHTRNGLWMDVTARAV